MYVHLCFLCCCCCCCCQLCALSCVQTCIDDVLLWVNSNKLKISWTQIRLKLRLLAQHLVFSRSTVSARTSAENSVPFKTSVKYLGVRLDRTLSVQQHISSICRASFLEVRRIASIRPYLLQDLLRQWSYPAFIIATPFSQVYQQTTSLGCSGCRKMQHGSW